MLGVPHIEVVVVDAHAHEIFCAGFFVEAQQMIGVEIGRLSTWDRVFEAELRRVSVSLRRDSLYCGLPSIYMLRAYQSPCFGGGLRTPVGPDAELGVAKPFGDLVSVKGFARSLKRPTRNFRKIGLTCGMCSRECGDGGGEGLESVSPRDLHVADSIYRDGVWSVSKRIADMRRRRWRQSCRPCVAHGDGNFSGSRVSVFNVGRRQVVANSASPREDRLGEDGGNRLANNLSR